MPATILALALFLSACVGDAEKFDRLEGNVRRALPVGTAARDAAHILDSMGIKHSALEPGTEILRALAGPVEKNIVTRADAEFVLVFDSTEHLTTIRVRKIYTGP